MESIKKDDNALNFLKLDYERLLHLIGDLHKHKIDYQKFYIALVTVIGTVSIALVNYYSQKEIEIKGANFKIENLIGLLLIISSAIGYTIIKNLVSIRKSEVYFNNSLIYLRNILIKEFNLSKEYPQLDEANTSDRKSADYITIVISSLVNMLFWIFGIGLLFSTIDKFGFTFIICLSTVGYIIVHLTTIERELHKGLRKS
jgi:hypothetical protein